MAFEHPRWRPTALILSGLNLIAAGFAMGDGEPRHAAVHVAIALLFGYWAFRLFQRVPDETQARLGEGAARLEEFQVDLGNLRRELGETQERLDFVERVLAQGQEARRVNPEQK